MAYLVLLHLVLEVFFKPRFLFVLSFLNHHFFLVIPHRPNNIFTIFSVYFLKNLFFKYYLYCLSYVHKMFIFAKMHFKWLWLLSSPRHFQRWCVLYRLSNVWKESKVFAIVTVIMQHHGSWHHWKISRLSFE